MRGIQQLLMAEPTERTLALVSFEHPFAKCPLMKAHADGGSDISTASRFSIIVYRTIIRRLASPNTKMHCIVSCDGEYKTRRIIADNKYRPSCKVFARNETMKIDKGQTPFHRETQTAVIIVVGICSSISVPKQIIWAECIVIRIARTRSY